MLLIARRESTHAGLADEVSKLQAAGSKIRHRIADGGMFPVNGCPDLIVVPD